MLLVLVMFMSGAMLVRAQVSSEAEAPAPASSAAARSDTDSITLPDAMPADSLPSDTLPLMEVEDIAETAARFDTAAVRVIGRSYAQRLDSLSGRFASWKYNGGDLLANPYYIGLFSTPTLYHGTLNRLIGGAALSARKHWDGIQARRIATIDHALLGIYARRPDLIEIDADAADDGEGIRRDMEERVKPDVRLAERVGKEGEQLETFVPEWEVVTRRPNFWTFKADVSLQFMQNYYSDNWYQGGESNNALLANTVLEANYNNKQKVTFSNKLEMKIGFYSSHSDSIHKYKTNTDLLRMTNSLGLQAAKNWYYNISLQSWTQFYRGYRSNNRYVYSDFMSPFESLLSVGMEYKLSKKRFSFSTKLSPLSCDFKYVGRRKLITGNGLHEGHHNKTTLGSSVTANISWTLFTNVTWTARFLYFTDYKYAKAEFENTFKFKINDFLSTTLYLYPRFDDGVTRKEGQGYTQFKENLTLGFNMTF